MPAHRSFMQYTIKKLSTIEQMLPSLPLIRQLTSEVTEDKYHDMLKEMVPHNYFQVVVYEGDKLVAVSGYWLATKIYCGKYIEIDNFVVDEAYRSKDIGKMLVDWVLEEGKRNDCQTALLDAYVENFKAHKFYYKQGFIARGFHYLKKI